MRAYKPSYDPLCAISLYDSIRPILPYRVDLATCLANCNFDAMGAQCYSGSAVPITLPPDRQCGKFIATIAGITQAAGGIGKKRITFYGSRQLLPIGAEGICHFIAFLSLAKVNAEVRDFPFSQRLNAARETLARFRNAESVSIFSAAAPRTFSGVISFCMAQLWRKKMLRQVSFLCCAMFLFTYAGDIGSGINCPPDGRFQT